MAKFRDETLAGRAPAWAEFLAGHQTDSHQRFLPRPESVATLAKVYDRYRRLVDLHGRLEAVGGPS
jgi:hypothetical protein